ncbi:MAG: GC-type dockerin domain-anchored protein [Planctomycetota bacterium]|nr:GC-type dockerin domain-anchored protein [Planctomycetota bacterium]
MTTLPTRSMHFLTPITLAAILAAVVQPASAQVSLPWFTIDAGGGVSSGGEFTLTATIAQHDAGSMSGGQAGSEFALTGGFWVRGSLPCPADFNADGSVDFFDYLDFVAALDAELPEADFNNDGTIDFFDYLDFASAFGAGCP